MIKRNVLSSVRFPRSSVYGCLSSGVTKRTEQSGGSHGLMNWSQNSTTPKPARHHRARHPDSVSIALVALIQLALYIFVF